MTKTKTARIWEETVIIPTYPVPSPDPNPMFFERRVNQGASGRVYPNPFTDRVNNEEKFDQEYQAVFLENDYIQLMVLPCFGGRIHAALDKTNNYNFIYRQQVIKPALIGLFGSWLSGGMEFNWPMHHRPSTFMPVEHKLEEGQDGSVTIWLSEHEPMKRMKGMVGVRVHPGKALFELKVQLFNRTPFPQPFLWWVNTAVHVNDDYQLIFPPDVESVTFHSRAFMAEYPIARQKYAGLDWTKGVDISWPKNVCEATSYFAGFSRYEFFGGYDHGARGGILHVAERQISPGKKLFTWGTGEFGSAWQETLTDEDGPYVELMASAYSDNQPDFSWLQPYETKSFSQFWFPFQEIGAVKNANRRVAAALESDFVGVCVTEEIRGVRVILTDRDQTIIDETLNLRPGMPFVRQFDQGTFISQPGLALRLLDRQGDELITYTVGERVNQPLPDTAKHPVPPEKIDSLEELYLTGLHVEQYLHFSLDPSQYWQRALEIDPSDSRCNNALGRLLLRRGDFAQAETHFRIAIQTLTRYNYNPYDSEPHYNLGLALAYQARYVEAYDHFYKATWSYAWRAPGYFALAQIDARHGEYVQALEHLHSTLETNPQNNKAHALRAALLRRLGDTDAALQVINAYLEFDPLDHWAHSELALLTEDHTELTRILRDEAQNYLDLAFDYASAGLFEEAINLLSNLAEDGVRGASYPIVYYALGYFTAELGDSTAAGKWYLKGSLQPPDLCFPVRLEEQIVLEAVREAAPSDGRAAYYLGNLYYDKKQYDKAITAWQVATQLETEFPTSWRNLGIALFNKRGDIDGAKHCYTQARKANPHDARLLMEMDQLCQRLGASPAERLSVLEENRSLVNTRDDLVIILAELRNQTSQPEKALEILNSHQFHAWEGGEGRAVDQFALANLLLGLAAVDSNDLESALEYFKTAQNSPDNLGVGRGMSINEALSWFHSAETLTTLGDSTAAEIYYQKVITAEKRASLWNLLSPLTYYAALSLRALGAEPEAQKMLQSLLEFGQKKIDLHDESSFYTSKPAMTVFDDDPRMESQVQGHYLVGLAALGLGHQHEAISNFETVLKLDPFHWEVRQMLKSLI
jgi:tetratricopeptide (TPR) repeat protein